MLTCELRRRLFRGLVWSFMVFAVVGCQSTNPPPHTRTSREAVEPAASVQTKRVRPNPVARPQRLDAGVTENTDGGDTRESVIEPRRPAPTKRAPQDKPREKKKIDEDERHPSKWRQKLKAKYA